MSSSRRTFLKTSAAVAAVGFPTIVPSSVFGQNAPSNRIQIGAIGVGRISRGHDMPSVMQFTGVAGRDNRIIAVCDLDSKRVELGKKFVDDTYTNKLGREHRGTLGYANYKELLANKDIDAVLISTPDHQHARLAIESVHAGKDVYLQKPASLTIREGRAMVKGVEATDRILQIGSQQRSWKQFHRACELVRNGRIGTLKRVEVGLPGDPAGGSPTPMPVPARFDYDAWLGSTPSVPYTVDRVMPQSDFDRPGWLRCEQFGAGMITGWGAHHVDTAHWGMDTEHTGPIEIWGSAEFPHYTDEKPGLWNVHGSFKTYARYANGVEMTISGDFENGIKFYGDRGWIFVCRDGMSTPTASANDKPVKIDPLRASDPKILTSVIGPNEVHLYTSDEQHGNWLDCIHSRKAPTAPAEIGHRACSTCLIHHIAMKTKRHLHWDPKAEHFLNDEEANRMLSRPQRHPYELS
ncbi:Gfo/Idh/MocA family oxidoreductase [Terriglobus saanensis]|uniref:Oxidoreductase domain protein n=1 Tax=Terriglobus saanensis (strain ATCC BAA-1853 / DSM 23119 / SP1PR4) TaxID=401053 RepID=E8V171_TERSS|nr:Gfo/Idh/MocA family oxidoreductase [Terriglobus saanensis]ADV83419.1 oxidoreductase domain protein [Terriglobus saanensis SP1PR4]